jgi:hypothetical protein
LAVIWRSSKPLHNEVAVTDVTKLSDEELDRMIATLQTAIGDQTLGPR